MINFFKFFVILFSLPRPCIVPINFTFDPLSPTIYIYLSHLPDPEFLNRYKLLFTLFFSLNPKISQFS